MHSKTAHANRTFCYLSETAHHLGAVLKPANYFTLHIYLVNSHKVNNSPAWFFQNKKTWNQEKLGNCQERSKMFLQLWELGARRFGFKWGGITDSAIWYIRIELFLFWMEVVGDVNGLKGKLEKGGGGRNLSERGQRRMDCVGRTDHRLSRSLQLHFISYIWVNLISYKTAGFTSDILKIVYNKILKA